MKFTAITCLWVVVESIVLDSFRCDRLKSLASYEDKIFSQNGEDGIVLTLLDIIGPQSRFYVEFGVSDGSECNTRVLRERLDFNGISMDGGFSNPAINLYQEFVTEGNILDLFAKYQVPTDLDVLSIDVDMFDWWILARILRDSNYRPKIIVAETNPTICMNHNRWSPRTDFYAVNSLPLTVTHPTLTNQSVWDLSRYSGANPLAFQRLGGFFGYDMVYCESCGVNCFLVLRSLLPKECRDHFAGNLPLIPTPCFASRNNYPNPGHDVDKLMRPALWLNSKLLKTITSKRYHPSLFLEPTMSTFVYCGSVTHISFSRFVVTWCDFLPPLPNLDRLSSFWVAFSPIFAAYDSLFVLFSSGKFVLASLVCVKILTLLDGITSSSSDVGFVIRRSWSISNTYEPPMPCRSGSRPDLVCKIRSAVLYAQSLCFLRSAELKLQDRIIPSLRLAHELNPADAHINSLLALLAPLFPSSAAPLASNLESLYISLPIDITDEFGDHNRFFINVTWCSNWDDKVTQVCERFDLAVAECEQIEHSIKSRVANALFPGLDEEVALAVIHRTRSLRQRPSKLYEHDEQCLDQYLATHALQKLCSSV